MWWKHSVGGRAALLCSAFLVAAACGTEPVEERSLPPASSVPNVPDKRPLVARGGAGSGADAAVSTTDAAGSSRDPNGAGLDRTSSDSDGSGGEAAVLELDPDWTPARLAPAAWYFATAADRAVVGPDTYWYEHQRNGPNLTQLNSWAPPLVTSSWSSGAVTMRFDGTKMMKTDPWSVAPIGTNTGFTVLAVLRSELPQTAGIASWWGEWGDGVWASLGNTNGLTLLDYHRLDDAAMTQLAAGNQDLGTGPHVVAWRFSPSTSKTTFMVDGALALSRSQPSVGDITSMPLYVGATSPLPTGLFRGDISELVIVDSAVSDENLQYFNEYARSTWNLPAPNLTGTCVKFDGTFSPASIRCDDGDAGTFGDHCSAGSCVGTVPAPGSPQELTPVAWYHAGDADVLVNTYGVTTWYDRSLEQRDLLNGYWGFPVLVGDGWPGNKPTVRFSGGNALKRNGWAGHPAGLESAFTVLAVLKDTATTPQTTGVVGWWNPNSYGQAAAKIKLAGSLTALNLFRRDDFNTQEYVGSISVGNAPHAVAWRYENGIAKVTVDGTTQTQTNATIGPWPPDWFLMGLGGGFDNTLFKGDISELAVIPRSISDAELARFNAYAQSEWGGFTLCTPSCPGNVAGVADGCGGTCAGGQVGPGGPCSLTVDCQAGLLCANGTCGCPAGTQCVGPGQTCGADNDCQSGLVCWQEGARHFDKLGGTGVCAPRICRTDVVVGGCGSLSQPCGRCEGTPRPCTTNANCVAGEVCGTNNGTRFGLPPDGDYCWPPDCNTPATTPPRCGTFDSACGLCDCSANCAGRVCGDPVDDWCGGVCAGLCDDGEPGCMNSLECAPGSVCGMGIGPRFGRPAGTNACWPADCENQDPSKPNGGVDPARCGVSPACVPSCESGSTGPNGCGGYCAACPSGQERRPDGYCAAPLTFLNRSGVDLPDPLEALPTAEVGATVGAFTVTDRGQAQYSIGIEVPPGRLGIQPNLELRYLGTKADGMLSLGWSLAGLSTVARCRKFVDRDGHNQQVSFSWGDNFCLDGQKLVKVSTGSYGDDGVEYRTEIDSFAKIISHGSSTDANGHYVGPAWFEVRTKEGRSLTYGRRGSSVVAARSRNVAAASDREVIRVWALNRIEDRSGNYLDIAYKRNVTLSGIAGPNNVSIMDTGELLPTSISYGGNLSSATSGLSGREHSRYVHFTYGARPDPTQHYTAGVQGSSNERLTRIETAVGDKVVKSYELRYEDTVAPSRPGPFQLAEVQECADDAMGERRCLPATTFQYYEMSNTFVSSPNSCNLRVVFRDSNGNGKDEGTCAGTEAEMYPVADFDGNGTEEVSPTKYVADVNGDGLPDSISCDEFQTRLEIGVALSTGTTSAGQPVLGERELRVSEPAGGLTPKCDDLMVMDRDGDGEAEFFLARSTVIVSTPLGGTANAPGGMQRLVWTIRSEGQVETPVWEWEQESTENLPSPDSVRVLDFNGDGLKDVLAYSSGAFRLWTNTGKAFRAQTLAGNSDSPGDFKKALVTDLDGDGKEDLVTRSHFFRSAGPGRIERRTLASQRNCDAALADLNGDGSAEIVCVEPNTNGYWVFGSARARLLGWVTDGLGKRTAFNYYEGTTTARTLELTGCGDTSTTRCLNKVGPLVSSTATYQYPHRTLNGPAQVRTYQYSGATLGLGGRGSFGFASRQIEDAHYRTDYTFHVDDFELAGQPRIVTTTPRNPMPSPLGAEERFEEETLTWGIFQSGAERPFPFLVGKTRVVYNGSSQRDIVQRTVVTIDPPDGFGNELFRRVKTYSSTAITDVPLIDESTLTTVLVEPDTEDWRVGLPDKRVVTSSRDGETRRRVVDYGYELPRMLLTSAERFGGPEGAEDPKQNRLSTFAPDAFGNVQSTCVQGYGVPQRCNVVLSRDDQNIYPRMQDAEGMLSEVLFAVEDGQRLAVINANGIPSERGFDAFGRLQQVKNAGADGKLTYSAATWAATPFADFYADAVLSVTSEFAGEGPAVKYIDPFGRVVKTESPGFHGTSIVEERAYDTEGRLARSSAPHTPGNATEGKTEFEYDGVGRLWKVTAPDGKVTEHSYTNVQAANATYSLFLPSDAMTLVVAKLPLGNIRLTVTDPMGEVTMTEEAANIATRSNGTRTAFRHGAFSALREVESANGTTTYDVDDWGRIGYVTDPALGARQRVHNGLDELVLEGDSLRISTYHYDDLGRLIEKRNAQGDTIASWVYDGPGSNEKGRLKRSWRRAVSGSPLGTWLVNSYEGPRGDLSTVEYHVGATLEDPSGGEVFATDYVYEDGVPGRLSEIIYPSNGGDFRVGYDYDSDKDEDDVWSGSGRLESAFSLDHPASPAFWTLTDADEGYRPSGETFGNGVTSTRTYYNAADCAGQPELSCAGKLREITTENASGPVTFAEHAWDSNGNLAALTKGDSAAGAMLYDYDHLDRLTREYFFAPQNEETVREYSYNSAGDLTFKTGAGTYNYISRAGVGGGVELSSIESTSYTYDLNGNQTDRSGPLAHNGYQHLKYNDFDMPYEIQSGTGPTPDTTTFEYTASGQRVVQNDNTVAATTRRVFIGDLYEMVDQPFTAPTLHRYKVLVGSRQVGEVVRESGESGQEVLYLHDDHLGSVTAITDEEGNVQRRDYEPFGAMTPEVTATGVRASFTGHDDDSSVGLVDMRGRLYDPKIGRFITADPLTGHPMSSQGWNRYAYVENNPLAFVDPTGFAITTYGTTSGPRPMEPDQGRRAAEQAMREAQARAEAAREQAIRSAREAAEKAAREAAEAQRRGQASADAAWAAAEGQANAQRMYELAQRAFGLGQAAAQAGQPAPGYGQPTLGGPAPHGLRGNELATPPVAAAAAAACSTGGGCVVVIGVGIAVGVGWLGYEIWKAMDAADKAGDSDGDAPQDKAGAPEVKPTPKGVPFTPDQQAVIDLAKEAKRFGVTAEQAELLMEWAREAGLEPVHDHRGTDHWKHGDHIRIGPINHIPLR